jgi:hypothetical protein
MIDVISVVRLATRRKSQLSNVNSHRGEYSTIVSERVEQPQCKTTGGTHTVPLIRLHYTLEPLNFKLYVFALATHRSFSTRKCHVGCSAAPPNAPPNVPLRPPAKPYSSAARRPCVSKPKAPPPRPAPKPYPTTIQLIERGKHISG